MVRDRILRMSVTDYLKNEGARLLGGGGGEVRLLGIIRRCRPTAGLSLIGMKKVQCWSTIYEDGPTLVQDWVDVSCSL